MRRVAAILGLLMGLVGVLAAGPARGEKAFQVTVSIVPQKYFVEKIGGELVDVSVMVEPGVDPHVYDPKPRQMTALAKSRIYFAIGVPFEDVWLEKFSAANPGIMMVHTETGIEKLSATDDDDEKPAGAQGGKAETHHHGAFDPHLWLSPPAVMIQARTIFNALTKVDPDHGSLYEANYKKFMAELVDLDLDLTNLFRDMGRYRQFMVFHPSWGYFAAAYGLEQVPVQVEGKEPKAADLQRLIQYARERSIKVIFVQPQYSTTSANVIAEAIGGQTVAADPMAEDWAMNLRQVAEKFKAALK